MTLLATLALEAAAHAQPGGVHGGPPPAPFTLDWPGALADVNPRLDDHALALFEEDEWNRALVCPTTRAATQPEAPGLLRCEHIEVARLAIGAGELWLGVAPEHHEHDGMHTHTQNVVVVIADPMRVAHTLVQWRHNVTDCASEVQLRRQRVIDLDGDGETELCIESVAESGGGLFHVMDLENARRRWYPADRMRGFSAWSLDTGAGRLVRRSTLDGRCPRTGYRPFVPVRRYADPIGWRAGVQGDDRAGVSIGARRERRGDAGCGRHRRSGRRSRVPSALASTRRARGRADAAIDLARAK